MAESFQLLSSMSPKLDICRSSTGNSSRNKKGNNVLSLKKLYHVNDKTNINKVPITVDGTPDSRSKNNLVIKHNTPILIPDSDDEKENKNDVITTQNLLNEQSVSKDPSLLPKNKLNQIQHWLKNMHSNNVENETIFSEVSAIFGDGLQKESVDCALSSTVIDFDNRRFDEMFMKKEIIKSDVSKESEKIVVEMAQDLSKSIIEESFNCENPLNEQEIRKNLEKVQNNSPIKASENNNISEKEIESELDALYGTSWRINKEHVLPKSEPRKNIHPVRCVLGSNTERKPNLSKLKPKFNNNERYSERKNTGIIDTIRNLCDSDSDSDEMNVNTRKKLNFDDDNDENSSNSDETKKKSKYFTPSKAKDNFSDDSFSLDSLEDRIRKKINPNNKQTKKLTPKPCNKNAKEVKNLRKSSSSDEPAGSDSSSDEEWDKEITRIIEKKKSRVVETYSFLESLSGSVPLSKCDTTARIFRNNYKQHKEQLAGKLFKLFNERVFDNSIPEDTVVEWNDRMTGTAGKCVCKKVTRSTGATERKVRIVLANKVLDSADRLRDTLIHEMCHAATWIVNCLSEGHGPYWKSWAYKAMNTFPELPPIRRCHDYVINTKYTYKCVGCGYSIGRHTKSLNVDRKRCGYCYGKFEILINKTSKKGETKTVPVTPRKEVNGFALFVKENYATFKNPERKHGDVMKILGQKFSEMKLKQTENPKDLK